MDATIVALSTPPGRGGVAVLRLSGSQSLSIAKAVSQKSELIPRKAHFAKVYDRFGSQLDSGLLLYFPGPHSFTGEDVIELQMHGSPVLIDAIISEILHLGARLAEPGEFSKRAFLNDKIDLVQAEAIADLIDAQSMKAAQMATQSLEGDFSKAIARLAQHIIQLRMYVEAAIDFPEEEIDFISDGDVAGKLHAIIAQLRQLFEQCSQGIIMREGIQLVLAGLPNAGKSTLINALAQNDIAIVTDIPGTTRDIMRADILIDDIPVHIIDTAGLRDSEDPVEKEGIKRAWKAIEKADVVVFLHTGECEQEETLLRQSLSSHLSPHTPILDVRNKIDVLAMPQTSLAKNTIAISAKTKQGLRELTQSVKEYAGVQDGDGIFLARRRHLDALEKCLAVLQQGQEQLSVHQAGELLAEDLRQAHNYLCLITGSFSSDDLLGEIFSNFCIGK